MAGRNVGNRGLQLWLRDYYQIAYGGADEILTNVIVPVRNNTIWTDHSKLFADRNHEADTSFW